MTDAPGFIPAVAGPPPSKAPSFIPAGPQADVKPPTQSGEVSLGLPKAIEDVPKALLKDPTGGALAFGKAVARGAVDLASTAAAGAAALAKSMLEPIKTDPKLSIEDQAEQNFNQSLANFTKNYEKIKSAIDFTNKVPADNTEQAMGNLLGMLPQAIQKGGDTVYDKTGSALAGAGFMGLATLLSFRPGIASDVVKAGIKKFGPGENTSPSTFSTAFDELAAQKPEEATLLAEHVGQVDSKMETYLKNRIQKYIDASDKELGKIGVAAAKANIKDLEADYATIKGKALKGQQTSPVGELLESKPSISPEKASGSLRTTIKEAQLAMAQPLENNASGESAASSEAVSRVADEKAKGQDRFILHEDDTVTPLTGVDAVDRKAAKGEVIVQRGVGDKPFTVLDRGGLTQGLAQGRVARATGLGLLDKPQGDKGLYISSGVPVTRAMVEHVFQMSHDAIRAIPGVKIAEAKLGAQYDKFIETFNPEAVGPHAKQAGSRIAQNFFQEAQRENAIWEKGKERRKYWLEMGKEAGLEFMRGMDAGKKFANPIWEKARLAYENWSQRMYQQDMATGFTYEPVDHYLPRLFVDTEGVRKWAAAKYGNKWADPRFIKERGFQLVTDAEKAGFTLKYTNPEEAMMARQRMGDIAELRDSMLKDFERNGLAIKAGKGETSPPPGYSPDSRRSPTGQRYWVHEDMGPLLHNAFDSKSLWEAQGNLGSAFRGWMELKNTVVPLKLALSAFHPLHVMHIDNAAHLTRATKLLAEQGGGTIAKAREFVVNVATGVPGTPGALWRSLYDNPKTGYPLLKVFQGKRPMESMNDAQRKAYQYLSESGMIPTRPKQEMNSSMQKMKDAWAASRIPAAAWHLPWALMSGLSHPIFGVWIPSLKIASLLKDAEVNMRLNPDLGSNSLARGVMLRDAARKVESRYGEMNYNSMFMTKMYKDIGVASTLSLGWNLGLIDQYVGGAIDAGKAGKAVGLDLLDPNSKGSELGRQVRAGNLDRPIQATIYVSTALMLGGLMHYFMTGKPPEELLDYTNPKSGDKDKYGKDERLNTMFYTREFASLYKHMEYQGDVQGVGDFILQKGSGLYQMMHAAVTGVNDLGQEIRKPDSPLYLQVAQSLESMYPELTPISIEAINKAGGFQKASGKTIALDAMGFTPSGKYVSQSRTENLIGDQYNKYVRPKETPYDQVVKSKDFKELQQAYNKDDPSYDRKLDAAQDKYDLKSADIKRLQKQFRHEDEFDLTKYQFSRLEWPQQRDLLDKMTPEERAIYLPISNKKHLRNHYEEPAK